MKLIVFSLLMWLCNPLIAQDFNAKVVVDASRIDQSNLQIFKSLETQISSFMNETSFSGQSIPATHRIPVVFYINITGYENNSFEATLQLQSERPVYNSQYTSPLLFVKDPQFNFSFQEFAPLVFNENSTDSNLVSVLSFYAYMALGLDADSFSFNGGSLYYSKARNIMSLAQARSFSGWVLNNRSFNRPMLINLLGSNESLLFKKCIYEYHINGMDKMSEYPVEAKNQLITAIAFLKSFGNNGTHRTLVQSFFDAKSDEIKNIFSAGPKIPLGDLTKNLQGLAPLFGNSWSQIQ